MSLNHTHDPAARSWLASANEAGTDFPIQNLPFGVFRRRGSSEPFRGGVAIGDQIVDLAAAASAGLFEGLPQVAAQAGSAPALNDLLAMGVLLGIAGASFGVALSLGSGSFPPRYKGLAMGLVGAGNIGTSLAALLAPLLAQLYGWKTVYGIAGLGLIVPVLAIVVLAKEPDDVDRHASFREHIACLFEKDGWAFAIIYAVTFGGFIGLTTFLPSYYYDQFGVSKIQAGQLTMLAAFMGAALRIFGGWISDHWGGINTLTAVLLVVAVSLVLCGLAENSLVLTTLLLLVCFAALGAGNGALFQLVPLRWPLTTAVAGSMIGEIGALGGGLVPNAMGLSKQYTQTYLWGFVLFAMLTLCSLVMMRAMQLRWTRTWAEKGGRARSA